MRRKVNNFKKLAIILGVIVILLAWQLSRWSCVLHQQQVSSSLQTILDTTQQALVSWSNAQRKTAQTWAQHPEIIDLSQKLLALPAISQSLVDQPAQQQLNSILHTVINENEYKGFLLLNPGLSVLASSHVQNIGQKNLLGDQHEVTQKLLNGQAAVSLPMHSTFIIADKHTNKLHNSHPSMLVAAPVMLEQKVIAILAFRIDPHDDFTAILQRGRLSDSGETYAFDSKGVLISNSRFDQQLQHMGLLSAGQSSILNISLRSPSDKPNSLNTLVNHPSLIPLTLMAKSAIHGNQSINVEGYLDYRGELVVGAWLWDKNLNMGITTEIDYDNAYKLLHHTYIIIAIAGLLTMLLIFLASLYVNSMRLTRKKH